MSSGNRIPSLDGLRAISILMVLGSHLYRTHGWPLNAFTQTLASVYGHLGVQVFFVISGFLITTLLIREHETTGKINLSAFYRRRTVRIFPACFAYIAIVAIVARPTAKMLLMAVTYTMSYARFPDPMDAKLWSRFWVLGHLWSLSVEEQFYLVWPFALVSAFRFRKTLAIAAIILAAISRAVLPHYMKADMDYFPPCLADSLASGCLLAIWRPRPPQWMLHPASFLFFSIASLLLALRFHHSVALPKYLGGTIPLMIALCIWIAVIRRDWILNNALVSALGAISYSLYLWQQPFLDRSSHHWWNAFPVNVMLALACAYLSYQFVEKPMLRFKMSRQPASQKTLEGLQEEVV